MEGKTGRKSRLSWTGRGGTRQPTHLLPQELLPYVGGHRIPDGNSLWRAKEKQVTLCICRFPAELKSEKKNSIQKAETKVLNPS